ncbi:MAG TPA: histidine phosphatase family protein [Candidatus Saccharimonadales bacterium]|nr:histidine phosphatase family protein [Candidatus Saccharimonadales bacterium]
MRVSYAGVGQAAVTGLWIGQEFPAGFDRYDMSTHVRARETAGALGISGAWQEDDRWRERDLGEFSGLSEAEQKALNARSVELRDQQPWSWCPPGGESFATGVSQRVKDIFDTYNRKAAGQRVIVISHDGTIGVAQYILERKTPDQWFEEKQRNTRELWNCQAVHYTRREPETGEIADQLRWMRSVCAWNPAASWNGGEWIAIPPRRRYSDAELLASVEKYPRLFAPDTSPDSRATYSN